MYTKSKLRKWGLLEWKCYFLADLKSFAIINKFFFKSTEESLEMFLIKQFNEKVFF